MVSLEKRGMEELKDDEIKKLEHLRTLVNRALLINDYLNLKLLNALTGYPSIRLFESKYYSLLNPFFIQKNAPNITFEEKAGILFGRVTKGQKDDIAKGRIKENIFWNKIFKIMKNWDNET